MKPESQETAGWSPILVAGAVLIGWAIWRALGGKAETHRSYSRSLADSAMEEPPGRPASPPPPSPSQRTSGSAPLDHLAHTAYVEEHSGSDSLEDQAARSLSANPPADEEQVRRAQDEVLKLQALDSPRLPGWSVPGPDRLPVPTFAPAVMAMGVVVFVMGLVTVWYVCAVGAIVFAVAAWRWVGELQGE